MTGIVAPSLKILLPVGLRRLDGTEFEIECVLDTGFDGELGLPATVLAELGALPLYAQDSLLADGSLISVAVSEVDVKWNEGWTTVYAQTLGGPLIGVAMCEGLTLSVRFVSGERAVLEA